MRWFDMIQISRAYTNIHHIPHLSTVLTSLQLTTSKNAPTPYSTPLTRAPSTSATAPRCFCLAILNRSLFRLFNIAERLLSITISSFCFLFDLLRMRVPRLCVGTRILRKFLSGHGVGKSKRLKSGFKQFS
jgi:hypothetical protein